MTKESTQSETCQLLHSLLVERYATALFHDERILVEIVLFERGVGHFEHKF